MNASTNVRYEKKLRCAVARDFDRQRVTGHAHQFAIEVVPHDDPSTLDFSIAFRNCRNQLLWFDHLPF